MDEIRSISESEGQVPWEKRRTTVLVSSDLATAPTALDELTFRGKVSIIGPSNERITCSNVKWDVARGLLTSDEWFVLHDGREFLRGKGFELSTDGVIRNMKFLSESKAAPPRRIRRR